MFINLSNHSSKYWQGKQLEEAQKYGELFDIEFPMVDPEVSEEEIAELAQRYFTEILKITEGKREKVVIHLMGELTFTFSLVNLLLGRGYDCIASTTERVSTEKDGKRISEFNFVKFRKYR